MFVVMVGKFPGVRKSCSPFSKMGKWVLIYLCFQVIFTYIVFELPYSNPKNNYLIPNPLDLKCVTEACCI